MSQINCQNWNEPLSKMMRIDHANVSHLLCEVCRARPPKSSQETLAPVSVLMLKEKPQCYVSSPLVRISPLNYFDIGTVMVSETHLFNIGHHQWFERILFSLQENEHLSTRLTRFQSHLFLSFHLVSLHLVGFPSPGVDIFICDNPKLVFVSFDPHSSLFRLLYSQGSVKLFT